jgi:hypothetical protein
VNTQLVRLSKIPRVVAWLVAATPHKPYVR